MCYYKILAQWNTGRGGANSTVFNKSAHIEIAFLLQNFINDAIMSLFVFIVCEADLELLKLFVS